MRPGFVHHDRTLGWRNSGRQSWSWRSQNRLSRNRWNWTWGGLYGSGFWYSPYGYADSSSGVGGSGPVIIVAAPSFNDFPAAAPEGADPASPGGCVIHKLNYDRAGKYVGERQIPAC